MAAMESGAYALDELRAREIKQKAGEFTLNLVKALLQTGWYSPEHSLARAATETLYEQFRSLTADERDISYVLISTVDARGVLIDGLLPEPLEVAKSLRGIMGDHFVAKFHEYFVKNQIASFTIKHYITEEEFKKFIALWVSWAAKATRGEPGHALLSDELTLAGIIAVTVVGLDEVPGARRQLPWPVKIALARLRKDLRRIPMLRDADDATIQRLKTQVIEDVLRPLSRPSLVVDLLLNADLAAEGQDIVTPALLEEGMVKAMRLDMAFKVADRLQEALTRLAERAVDLNVPGWEPQVYKATLDRMTRKVLVRLAEADFSEAYGLLQQAYGRGLIELGSLPESLQTRIRATELTEWFLKDPAAFYRDFASASDVASYRRCSGIVKLIVPELIRRQEAKPLAAILAIIHRHLHEDHPSFPTRKELARALLSHFEEAGHVDRLVEIAIKTPKEDRGGLVEGLVLFRDLAVPSALFFLIKSDETSERRAAFDILERVGAPAVPHILAELRAHRHPWYVARNLIELLGLIAEPHDKIASQVIEEYRSHPKVQVREAALEALARIHGASAGPHLLAFLDDPEPHVARRAIYHLSSIRYTDAAFIRRLMAMLPTFSRKPARGAERPSGPIESFAVVALSALTRYGPDLLVTAPEVEVALTELVRRPSLLRRLLFWLRLRRKIPEDLQVLAIKALGSIGGTLAERVLDNLARSGSAGLRGSASEALERIKARKAA